MLNELGFSYLYDDITLPPGSDIRLQVAIGCDRYPHTPLAHRHSPELIIDGWGDFDSDYTDAAHERCLEDHSARNARALQQGYQQIYSRLLIPGDCAQVLGIGTAVYRDGDLVFQGRAIHPPLASVFVVRTGQTLREMAVGVFTLPNWA
jgi:hypothetical protein